MSDQNFERQHPRATNGEFAAKANTPDTISLDAGLSAELKNLTADLDGFIKYGDPADAPEAAIDFLEKMRGVQAGANWRELLSEALDEEAQYDIAEELRDELSKGFSTPIYTQAELGIDTEHAPADGEEDEELPSGVCDRCGTELTFNQVVDGYCPGCDDTDNFEEHPLARRTDPVGYTYQAENHSAADLIEVLIKQGRLSPGARGMRPEDALDQMGEVEGVDRQDEYSFESDDFPKVIFR